MQSNLPPAHEAWMRELMASKRTQLAFLALLTASGLVSSMIVQSLGIDLDTAFQTWRSYRVILPTLGTGQAVLGMYALYNTLSGSAVMLHTVALTVHIAIEVLVSIWALFEWTADCDNLYYCNCGIGCVRAEFIVYVIANVVQVIACMLVLWNINNIRRTTEKVVFTMTTGEKNMLMKQQLTQTHGSLYGLTVPSTLAHGPSSISAPIMMMPDPSSFAGGLPMHDIIPNMIGNPPSLPSLYGAGPAAPASQPPVHSAPANAFPTSFLKMPHHVLQSRLNLSEKSK